LTPLDQSGGMVQLERSHPKLRLIDGDSFVELLVDNYAKLSPR
jgi:restriction system protein